MKQEIRNMSILYPKMSKEGFLAMSILYPKMSKEGFYPFFKVYSQVQFQKNLMSRFTKNFERVNFEPKNAPCTLFQTQ